jgi:hypothetical protein
MFGTDGHITWTEPQLFDMVEKLADVVSLPRLPASDVQGVRTDTRCGPKCWNAKGPDCQCECAGENHRSGHPWNEQSMF